MAGIYIHIPFCKSRCTYCAFYSTTRTELRQRYVEAVCKEMTQRASENGQSAKSLVNTIYLGGGTPSQLAPGQVEQLLTKLRETWDVDQGAEITMEMNPDDVTYEYAAQLVKMGVNRVSMGAQTFDDQRLKFVNRRHTAVQVARAVNHLRRAGICNISIDLMYGFPCETLSEWQSDILAALALDVEHLSAYCLTIEEGTPLYETLRKGENEKMRDGDEEAEREMYYTLKNLLEEAGYEHYELSNFARPGFRSRHNNGYWTGLPYIGLGAAAHSYNGHIRRWNPDNIDTYIKGVESGRLEWEQETLDANTRYNEQVMLALRTVEGLNTGTLTEDELHYLMPIARKYISLGLLRLETGRLCLTREGLFLSDMVTADLMRV